MSVSIVGGNWMLTNRSKSVKLQKTLYYETWDENSFAGVEAVILLELIEVKRKGRYIRTGSIAIEIDNSTLTPNARFTLGVNHRAKKS